MAQKEKNIIHPKKVPKDDDAEKKLKSITDQYQLVGYLIRQMRNEKKLSQKDLSMKIARMDKGCIDRSKISRIENGLQNDYSMIDTCAEVFGMRGWHLFEAANTVDVDKILEYQRKGELSTWLRHTLIKS